MSYHGDIPLGNTIDIKFTTRQSSGAPTTLAGSPVISAYIGNSTIEITAGITLTVDFDSRTGLNNVRVVASGGNGFTAATDVELVITTGTVNSVSVVGEVIGSFSIENRSALRPATVGRTLVVDAAGLADANVVKIGPTGSGTVQTARDLGASVLLSSGIGTGQLDFALGVVKANATQWLGGTIPAVNVTGVPLVDSKYLFGTILATPATAGIMDVNAKKVNNVATTSVTTINANLGTTQPVNFTGAEASALVKGDAIDWNSVAVTGMPMPTYTQPTGFLATTFPTGTVANTTNITDGTITTVTNVNMVNGLASNVVTAASIAATALNGKGDWLLASSYTVPLSAAGTRSALGMASANLDAQFAALDADIMTLASATVAPSWYTSPGTPPTVSQIATAVWQDATAGDFTVAGSVGKSLFTSGNVPGAASGLLIAGSNAATAFTSLSLSSLAVIGAVTLNGVVTAINVGNDIRGIKVDSVAAGAITDAAFTVPADAAGPATGILGMVQQLFQRFFGKSIRSKTGNTIKTYLSDGTTVRTTQATVSNASLDEVDAAS